ncbi:MAG TPA: antibiotic biosynthesis monooxygenase [Streptosporangiaceae bacterium]
MSVSFLAAAAAALVAAVITGILVRRLAGLPRLNMVAWVLAAAGITIALAAQALGFHRGFNASTFRAVEIGARLIAPMALAWGLTELVGRSFAGRFAGRLVLAALTVIAGVILAADPLSGVTFTTAWPAASDHYQLIPTKALLGLAAVTGLWAVVALVIGGMRAQRQPGWRDVLPPVATAAVAILLTEGLAVHLPVKSAYAALCLAVAGLTWFTGLRASRLRLAALHDMPDMGDDHGWRDGYPDDPGYAYQNGSGSGRGTGDTDFGGLYRPGSGRVGGANFGGLYRPDDDGFRDAGFADNGGFPDTGDIGSDPGYGFYRTDTDLRPVVNGEVDRRGEQMPGIVETGDILPAAFDVFAPTAHMPTDDQTALLFGQIAIYTLLDGQAEEFDRLAQQVVEKVKALEPDTLAYIVHGVPSAPMQRILYEVYRDGGAYEEHQRQPYIQDFEEGRQPLVLATNVIELGVRQAKLSPLSGQDVPPSLTGMANGAGLAGPATARPPSDRRQRSDRPRGDDARPREESRPRDDHRDRRDQRPAGEERLDGDPRWHGDPGRPSDPGRLGDPGRVSDPGRHSSSGWHGDPGAGDDPGWRNEPPPQPDPGWRDEPGPGGDPGWHDDGGQGGDHGWPDDHGWPGGSRRDSDSLPPEVPPLPDDLADHPRLAGRSGVYGRPRPASPPGDPGEQPRDNGSR